MTPLVAALSASLNSEKPDRRSLLITDPGGASGADQGSAGWHGLASVEG